MKKEPTKQKPYGSTCSKCGQEKRTETLKKLMLWIKNHKKGCTG